MHLQKETNRTSNYKWLTMLKMVLKSKEWLSLKICPTITKSEKNNPKAGIKSHPLTNLSSE